MNAHPSVLPRFGPLMSVACWSLLALAALLVPGFAPEPSPVPRRWELQLEPGALAPIALDLNEDGQSVTRTFYYFTYSVTNRSGQDLLFAPSFELVDDSGEIIRSGTGVPGDATRHLLKRLGDPLLLDQIEIVGSLKQGPENSRKGLVLWPAKSLRPGEVTLYASGFSGETAVVQRPGHTGDNSTLTLRKTRMIRYANAGEQSGKPDQAMMVAEDRWIMR